MDHGIDMRVDRSVEALFGRGATLKGKAIKLAQEYSKK